MFLNTVQQGQNIAICGEKKSKMSCLFALFSCTSPPPADCTSPFEVNIVTDAVDDNKGASNTVSRSRGGCAVRSTTYYMYMYGVTPPPPHYPSAFQAPVWSTPRSPAPTKPLPAEDTWEIRRQELTEEDKPRHLFGTEDHASKN